MPCCRPSRESEADAAARALGVDATNEAGLLAGAGGRCTARCLLCIIACWLGLMILGCRQASRPLIRCPGDPRRLLFGVDYLGDVCSVEEHTTYHADGSYKTYDVSALRELLPAGGAVVCGGRVLRGRRAAVRVRLRRRRRARQTPARGDTHGPIRRPPTCRGAVQLRGRRPILSYCAFDAAPTSGGRSRRRNRWTPTPRPTRNVAPPPPARRAPRPRPRRQSRRPSTRPRLPTCPCRTQAGPPTAHSLVGKTAPAYCRLVLPGALPGACDFARGFSEPGAHAAAVP